MRLSVLDVRFCNLVVYLFFACFNFQKMLSLCLIFVIVKKNTKTLSNNREDLIINKLKRCCWTLLVVI